MKRLAAAAIAVTLARASGPAQPAPNHELRFSMAGDPKTFDPLQVAESHAELIRYLTGGVLARVDRAADTLQPELAESWRITDGGRAISFHLRSGLKFSDGSPLD